MVGKIYDGQNVGGQNVWWAKSMVSIMYGWQNESVSALSFCVDTGDYVCVRKVLESSAKEIPSQFRYSAKNLVSILTLNF